MRKFAIGILAFTLVAFGASMAAASLPSGPPHATWLVDSTDASEVSEAGGIISLSPDATFLTVFVEVHNPDGNAIQSLFTSTQMTGGVTFGGGGSLSTILLEPGFGGPSLGVIAQPQLVFGETDRIITLAFASTGNPTRATGPEITTQITFNISGPGAITHINGPGDESVIDGVVAPVGFTNQIVIVPEPGTALLMGLGLAGLALGGRRED
jgi:hypothetical protein